MADRTKLDIELAVQSRGAEKARREVQSITDEAAQLHGMLDRFRKMAVFAGIATGAVKAARKVAGLVQQGNEWNRVLDDTRASMSAMIATSDPVFRGDMERSLLAASVAMRELEEEASRTGLALESVFGMFSATAPVAAAAGISMQKYTGLVLDAAQASNVLGIETAQATSELRGLLSGQISRRSVLARALGLQREEVALALEQGRVYELLSERLERYQLEVTGVTAESNRLKNSWKQVLQVLSEPVFDQIEGSIQSMRGALSSDEFQQEVRVVAEMLGDLFLRLRQIGDAAFEQREILLKLAAAAVTMGISFLTVRTATLAAAAAMRIFTAAAAGNPAMLVAMGLTFLMPILLGYQKQMAEAAARTREATKAMEAFRQELAAITSEQDRKALLEPLVERLQEARAELRLYEETLKNLPDNESSYGWIQRIMARTREIEEIERKIAEVKSDQIDQQIDQARLLREQDQLIQQLEAQEELVAKRLAEIARLRMTESERLAEIGRREEEALETAEKRRKIAAGLGMDEMPLVLARIERELELELAELGIEREEIQRLINEAVQEETEERGRALLLQERLAQSEAALALAKARAARRQIETDPRMGPEFRRTEIIPALEEENRLLQEQIRLDAERLQGDLNGDERIEIENRLLDLYQQQADVQNEIWRQQHEILSGISDWMDQLGTTGQQVSDMVTGTLDASISGLATSIEGLINGTMSWEEAWRNLTASILRDMVRLVSQFIAQQLVMAAVRRVMAAKEMAVMNVEAVQAAAAWSPAAIAASIATLGSAAAAGTAAYVGSVASGTAAAVGMAGLPGFERGGYTGPGGRLEPAGIVHKGEVVFDQPAVNRLGVDFLEALRLNEPLPHPLPGYAGGGVVGGGGATGRPAGGGRTGQAERGSSAVNIAFVRDLRNELREEIERGFKVYDDRRRMRGERVPR